MKKTIVIIMNVILYSLTSFGQTSTKNCKKAQDFFESFTGECKSSITAHNCVHLDVTDSYDFEGKEFIFQWQMGDGTNIEGMEINHCYSKPGNYTAVLSLLDPITKVIIDEEAKVDIKINGAFKLEMDVMKSSIVNKPITFDYSLSFPETSYTVDEVYWHFGDNIFSCEKNPKYTYSNPGHFKANLLMKLSSDSNSEIFCASDTIEIKMADPSEGLLKGLFDSTKIQSRFLADDVHYKILTKQNNRFIEIKNQDSLPSGATYKLLAYRGESVFDSPEIAINAGASNGEVLSLINTYAKSLAESEPLHFNSLFFELDQDALSKKNKKSLKKNIELLKKFPMFGLAIGVYTNSKGSLVKGVKLSIQRAGLIQDYMIENGISAHRIRVMNPDNTRSLINSCVTGKNCDYADPSLDRKADFKILNDLIYND